MLLGVSTSDFRQKGCVGSLSTVRLTVGAWGIERPDALRTVEGGNTMYKGRGETNVEVSGGKVRLPKNAPDRRTGHSVARHRVSLRQSFCPWTVCR